LDINGISAIDAAGNITLAGTLDVAFTAIPTAGQMFDIIHYGGIRNGMFSSFDNVVDSPFGPDTVTLSIDYGSGSDDTVRLTVESAVPEPTTFGLLAAIALVLAPVTRRRRLANGAQ
jgi:MYXO-CTERM domain-containing protein